MVSAASAILGSSRRIGGPPPAMKPKAGEWPPFPGRYRIVNAVSNPDRTSQGTGHQAGAGVEKIWFGSAVNRNYCDGCNGARKPYAMTETGMPTIAASTSAPIYRLERIIAIGSMAGGAPGGARAACSPALGGVPAPPPFESAIRCSLSSAGRRGNLSELLGQDFTRYG